MSGDEVVNALAYMVGKIVKITTQSEDRHDGYPTVIVGRLVSLAVHPFSQRTVGGVAVDYVQNEAQALIEGGLGHSSHTSVWILENTTVELVSSQPEGPF